MPTSLTLPIIGYHHSPLSQKFGIPRQPNLVAVPSYIEMLAPYHTPDAFKGLEAFSHLWLTWHTHHNQAQANFKPQVRPPRLGGNAKLGVFATRSTYRPSTLGLSVVKLQAVEETADGVIVHILGADMVDGTPIVDIKPYVAYSDALPEAISGFAPDKPATKAVIISEVAQQQFNLLVAEPRISDLNSLSNSELLTILQQEDLGIISQLIAQDPRPAYRQAEMGSVFVMRYKQFDIHFKMTQEGSLEVFNISRID